MIIFRRVSIIMVALASGLALTGCVGGNEIESAAYTQPAWMAEHRVDFEEGEQAFKECLETGGVQTTTLGNGTVRASMIPEHEAEEVVLQISKVNSDCEEQRESLPGNLLEPAEQYERMLDVRDCLIAQGYPLSEPQSRDTWIEEFKTVETGGQPYLPYLDLASLIESGSVDASNDEINRLQREICIATDGGGGLNIWEVDLP